MALPRNSMAKEKMRSGFSILEMLVVVLILGIAASFATPAVSRFIRHDRVNRASALIVADLQNVFAVAGRQRAPVRFTANTAARTYTVTDRSTGTVISTRDFSSTSEYSLSALVFSPTTIDVFPSGVSSSALTATITGGDYSRTVTASTAGFVRITP
jgi:prepilin-type N-terminal cleavage/methylation domain-containing protein